MTAPAGEQLRESAAVLHWFASARHDGVPEEEQQRYLSLLGDFAEFAGMAPDELVAFCFLRKKDTGERFSSVKRRGEVNLWIQGWVKERGFTGKDAVANGNVVRGFFIHNGVLIQGHAWRG
jgi:hypothetical protein